MLVSKNDCAECVKRMIERICTSQTFGVTVYGLRLPMAVNCYNQVLKIIFRRKKKCTVFYITGMDREVKLLMNARNRLTYYLHTALLAAPEFPQSLTKLENMSHHPVLHTYCSYILL